MGLDDQFSVIKTQILLVKPTPDLSGAYHLVLEDEQQRTIASSKRPVREVAAFQATFQRKQEQTWNKQEKGWTKNKKVSQVDKTKQCSKCGRDGHNKYGCFKIIGYPEWWPGKGKGDKPRQRAAMVETKLCPIPGMTKEQYAMFLKLFSENLEEPMIANMVGNMSVNDSWVVDSISLRICRLTRNYNRYNIGIIHKD
uniref:Gag-pre-integrase domain, Gag-polypeptide of LTR copia-type n=1 Tax=Tanacetum cinerariifolium TaxID=118510 RepID=A0A6L2KUS9_TANCI|nr:Gag-pre-integrase domain, Gag-polypeptide of LTR copia-type [Tanacetum cinerariifolium]